MKTGGKLLIALLILQIYLLPFTGYSALKPDYFQPVFQSEHQHQDAYVISQKYFAMKDVLPSEFYKNSNFFVLVDHSKAKNVVSYEDMLKLMPTTLSPTSSERLVAQALVDNAFRMFLTSENSQELTVVKAFDRIEKAMNTNVVLGKTEEGIEQKVNLNYDLVSNTTKLIFSGSFDSTASYSADTNEATVTISKNISNGTVSLNHIENSIETKDIVTLSYNF